MTDEQKHLLLEWMKGVTAAMICNVDLAVHQMQGIRDDLKRFEESLNLHEHDDKRTLPGQR